MTPIVTTLGQKALLMAPLQALENYLGPADKRLLDALDVVKERLKRRIREEARPQ